MADTVPMFAWRLASRSVCLLALAASIAACRQRDAAPPPAPAGAAAQAPAVALAGRRITGGPQPAVPAEPLAYVASGTSPLAGDCTAGAGAGVAFTGAEVEPRLSIHPTRPGVMVAAWQQDRWSDGGARALVAATSLDGGRNWVRTPLPFSRCGGGSVLNGGDYERASDPWVSYGADGVLHAMSLSFSGATFQAGSANAMLASRSFDDGRTWTAAATLIRDGEAAFNDKNAITADPRDARYVYAVWDRLTAIGNRGPTYFTRSTDGGAHWEAARPIFDPGQRSQTIGNLIVVLSDGTLLDVFDRIDSPLGGLQTSRAQVIRSTDHGATWSAPIAVGDMLAIGARDPTTGQAVRDGSIVPTAAAGPHGEAYVAWQDARFSGGARDAIALSRSGDGGLTWSAPVRVNGVPAAIAFTPTLHVADDGTVAVLYQDFRNDTAAAPLWTDTWLARSQDGGATWSDLRLGGSFDLTRAPSANGLFLGDYMGLGADDARFLPLAVRSDGSDSANRTDVVAFTLTNVPKTLPAPKRGDAQARRMPPGFVPGWRLRQRVSANLWRRVEWPPQRDAADRFMPHARVLQAAESD